MTRWEELLTHIDRKRTERKEKWLNALIVQVKRAAEQRICAEFEPYRVRKSGRTIEVSPRKDAMTLKTVKADVPAITLCDLPAIENAKLAFRVVLQDDERRIEQYTVSAVGTERDSGQPWYVRLDLDAEQKGNGPCSHAMLHCHVGVDPTNKGGQESRVPLPWLDPDEAVAWVLATLDPRLEPL